MYTKATQKRMKGIERVLQDEPLLDAVSGLGSTGKKDLPHAGVLVLTQNKLVWYRKRMLGRYQADEYPLTQITRLKHFKGAIRDIIEFHMGIDQFKCVGIMHREYPEQFVKNIENADARVNRIPGNLANSR